MKKRLFCLFIALIFVLCGCMPDFPGIPESESDSSDVNEGTAPLLEDYLIKIEEIKAPVRDYGVNEAYSLVEKDLVVQIFYPVDGSMALQTTVNDWIASTVEYYLAESEGSTSSGEAAELNIDYNSYVAAERFAGIKFSGIYERPYMAHPTEVIKTFNMDIESKTFLKLEQFLNDGGMEKLTQLVIEATGADASSVDENFLEHWLLTDKGLEITLNRGDYLPMSEGTKTAFFTYEEISDIFFFPEEITIASTIDPTKPMIALTFDDGPSAHTGRLLDIFAAHGGKATFFVVGNIIYDRPAVVERIVEEGHEIGGHSWSHRDFTKLTDQEVTDQIMNTRAKIYEVSGKDTLIIRPPYGARDKRVASIAAECGVSMILWSVDTLDWELKDADLVYESIMSQAYDGAIILCHDLHKTTVDAMERAIPDLIAKGYQLVTVTDLLTCDGGELVPGKAYFNQ